MLRYLQISSITTVMATELTRGSLYVQIVENARDGACQTDIANLGRADELAASGALASLIASGAKLTDQVLLAFPISPAHGDEIGEGELFDIFLDRLR